MMTMITVTQEDIDQGDRFTCRHCPLSLAIQRHLLPNEGASVTGPYVRVYSVEKEEVCRIIPLPLNVKYFVRDFDAGSPVAPFSFEIDLTAGQVEAMEDTD